MDWSSFSLGFAAGQQDKKRRKPKKEIRAYRNAISEAVFNLSLLLNELALSQSCAIEEKKLDDLRELAPLFPMAEILSLQGFAGPSQEDFLRNYFNVHSLRYNLRQFLAASIEQESVYPEWYALCGLDEIHFGQIWYTLTEIICRRREPKRLQEIINYLGTIFYHFWLLEYPDIDAARIHFQFIIDNLTRHGNDIQNLPYLHAVMLLQRELSRKFGGEMSDYLPQLESTESFPMAGAEGLVFIAHHDRDYGFRRLFAVRKINSPDDPDLIWELSDKNRTPTGFYSE